ncbi:MAG TPA: flagellar motor switch protein FliG [Armatimonadota bacterium]|nr:flagellar motor switch protein FliG [Armatimonadota bacterium]
MAAPMTNLEKAAGMLVCLGVEKSSQVLAHLSYQEVQLLANQMSHTGRIAPTLRHELIGELKERYRRAEEIASAAGGMDFVHSVLSQTFGEERAALVLEQLAQPKTARPFNTLRNADAHRILDILASEHPGVIALVLYYLPREKAAQVLAGLPINTRHEVVMRLINLQTPVPTMVARLEQLLTQKLTDLRGFDEDGDRDYETASGARTVVEILARAHPTVEKRVYEFLQERDPALAEEVRKSMFVFEDIAKLEPRALQMVLRELSSQEIAVSLKGAAEELQSLVFANVSDNFSKSIKEELEYMGPIRVSEVEETQQKVVSIVRRLSEDGTITLNVGEEAEMMV